MTIRSPGNLVTEMKRLLVVLLATVLLLSSCSKVNRFERDAEGIGYTDSKTDIFYKELDPCYEPAAAGETVGEYLGEEKEVLRTFRQIPGLEPSLFLTDDYLHVYYAGKDQIDAAAWTVEHVLICEEDAISVELFRYTAGKADTAIAALRAAWFVAESNERLPIGAPQISYRVKLTTAAYPNLLYSFSFFAYESGEAYFYDAFSRHTVAVPESLLSDFLPADKG